VFLVLGPAYICYLCFVDVPMYFKRWLASDPNARPSFIEGLRNTGSCAIVTRDFEAWREDMLWMAGYFSVGVWISIWLMRAPWMRASVSKTK